MIECECAQCTTKFTSKRGSDYCSDKCRKKHYSVIRGDLRREARESEVWICHFCGADIKDRKAKRKKFCNDQHADTYWSRKQHNTPLKISLDHKTIIYTRKYGKVPELVLSYRNKKDNYE